jgi:thioester reductase-like protein
MEPTYFTCTLGEAAKYQQDKLHSTVNDFVDLRARTDPDTPVVGFYEVGSKPSGHWRAQVFTFRDIRRGVAIFASALSKKLRCEAGSTVALLCPSSIDFLFIWLALMWLGHPALLIAPQCAPSAIAELCQSCSVRELLYDEIYEELATKASESASKPGKHLDTTLLPFTGEDTFEIVRYELKASIHAPAIVSEHAVAYLHHTSGTSSGIPKPIPQTHRGGIGVLPLLDGQSEATFTTTPLYHGGIADLFRAWTSKALIWLFPGKELPITATNVNKCLEVAAASAQAGRSPPVKYFSSVPYILQMIAEDKIGLEYLRNMDIVGVGGAALPTEVGDNLVKQGVNLISRFGSAECGFLMSSHRNYEEDEEWQYLRSDAGAEYLKFETNDNGLSELVIKSDWPHMVKRNRDDGSLATADLFSHHERLPNAWRYHSRADSQLTLITGKKFDPAPLEDAIKASNPTLLQDVLIFGDGQPYPGALLFRTGAKAGTTDEEVIRHVEPVVARLNKESQSHARISKSMLVPMQHLTQPLEKSSKGTLLRRKAQERFAEDVENAYYNVLPNGIASYVADEDVPAAIRDIIVRTLSKDDSDDTALTDDYDLFEYGVDSVASIQIRHAISNLVTGPKPNFPISVVQDASTIARLSDMVLALRSGNHPDEVFAQQDAKDDSSHHLMLNLVEQHSKFKTAELRPDLREAKDQADRLHVLLTGPTGSLGAHILSQLLHHSSVAKVHLLVRGATQHACHERVVKALASRRLRIPEDFDTKVSIHSCKLSDPNLGLEEETHHALASEVDVILHLAWSVNFLLPVRSFANTHIAGLQHLINFSLSSPRAQPPRLMFCSSVASVSQCPTTSSIPELIISDPSVAGPTGYAKSKWIAEQICHAAHHSTRLRGRIAVARVGQLSGATDTGVWSMSEAYPLMLASSKITGVLPDLDEARRWQGMKSGEVLCWLPVDVAAKGFVECAVAKQDDAQQQSLAVYHILNPSTKVTWSNLVSVINKHDSEVFKIVPAEEWLSQLEDLQDHNNESKRNHPALKLLGFWKDAYTSNPHKGDMATHDNNASEVEGPEVPRYETTKTYERMPVLEDARDTMSDGYMLKLWTWIKENI